MRPLSVITLLTALLLPTGAFAQVQTITATHTYIMGDNDSRNDARQLCFLQAKRKVLEKAGSFIQSHSVVDSFNLTKDQITSYSAAVLSVETVKEDFGFNNGHNELTLTVKADVDVEQVKQLMAAIVADKSLGERVAQQQQQIRELEGQVQTLNSRVNVATPGAASDLRKDRTVVFENIAELDRIQLVAAQRIAREKESIREKTEIILKYVLRGMTPQEVMSLVGKPVKEANPTWVANPTTPALRGDLFWQNWYYGELWICFGRPLGPKDWRVDGIGRDGPFPDGLVGPCVRAVLSR